MTNHSNVKVIKKQLEQVQARILENEKLQEEHPKQKKGLLIALATLKQLENEMIEALKDAYIIDHNEVYEIRLTGKNIKRQSIPIMDLGQFLIDQQTAINSFGSEKILNKYATIPTDIINKSQMNLVATAGGSFRIILTTPQKVLCDIDNAESTVKYALKDIQKLVECGSNKQLIKTEESRLGPKKITAYKNLLHTLYEKNIDMNVSTRTSNKEDSPIFSIKKENAKTVYNVLIEKEKPSKDDIQVTGVLEAVDFTTSIHKFKIVAKQENKEKTIPVYFKDDLDEDVLNHMKKLSKVNLRRITNKKGVGEKDSQEYQLLNFDD